MMLSATSWEGPHLVAKQQPELSLGFDCLLSLFMLRPLHDCYNVCKSSLSLRAASIMRVSLVTNAPLRPSCVTFPTARLGLVNLAWDGVTLQ
jgi:hypothetical protein